MFVKLNHQLNRVKALSDFKNLGYLPRWIILCLDVFVVLFSTALTYLMLQGMGLVFFKERYMYIAVCLIIIFHLFFFWLFRTYSGIIRHSSIIDAIKIFAATFFVLAVLIGINYGNFFSVREKIFMNSGLVINFVLTFSGLFLYRVLVKHTFDTYLAQPNKQDLIRAIIYGSDANAISVANALKTEKPSRFKIIGFIDKENNNTAKRLLDVPILNYRKRVPVIMRSVEAEALIIADRNLSKEQKLAIVDECLEYNYKVYTVPLISDWENNTEISKKVKSFQIQDLLERKPIELDNKLISDQLRRKVVLVTGAAGSIGSEIVRQVAGFDPKLLIILDQAESPLHNLEIELRKSFPSLQFQSIIGDVRVLNMMEEVFRLYKPEVVFHAAAYKHVPLMEKNPEQAIFANVLGTKIVADLACKYNCASFVMISTDKAVNPSNVMGASKRIAEKYVQSLHYKIALDDNICKTKFITTRFGNVLGSNGSVVPLFTEQIANGGPITITHPDIIRYFMTIPEACQLVLEAGAMGNGGEIYIFDMGKPVKILDLAKKMIRLAGLIPDKDIEIKFVGLRPGEKLYEELLNDSAKTLPTYHEKIMISSELQDITCEAVKEIDKLIEIASYANSFEIVKQMKLIVPEFVSLNSKFENLDNKTAINLN